MFDKRYSFALITYHMSDMTKKYSFDNYHLLKSL